MELFQLIFNPDKLRYTRGSHEGWNMPACESAQEQFRPHALADATSDSWAPSGYCTKIYWMKVQMLYYKYARTHMPSHMKIWVDSTRKPNNSGFPGHMHLQGTHPAPYEMEKCIIQITSFCSELWYIFRSSRSNSMQLYTTS